MAPILLFGGAIAALIIGALTGLAPLVALAGVAFVAALLLFVIVPLVALTASKRAEEA